ncbi:PREDICTED: transcription factor bHLH66-like isoform X2 [Nelumbo nucifera]|uniref:Transcription factor bHLH66-like isoform X2 n=1 Tax=Nelumbo nucifera TaxID=4432 RepID=A0A1U8QC99_NELNU|nr:PREDICTED: transcription factor bHLH66-like isoform X2 [Nelumbo nucifera]
MILKPRVLQQFNMERWMEKIIMFQWFYYGILPQAVHLRPLGEGEVENKLMDVENQNLSQNHASSKKESNEDTCNVFQPYPEVTIAVSGSPSKLCGSVSRKRASSRSNITDRLRRARIGQGFKALRELLPHFKEGNKASLLDNVIDYVKYLQFQIKVLSQSKLGGEAINAPLVHLEGYGHYLLNQQMLKEPLEEIMGRLMEVDMGKATQLLQSKGLAVIEDSLAEKLFQAG